MNVVCLRIPIFYIYEYEHSIYVSCICINGRILGPSNITYVHVYCHPQTDCFIVSQLFSMARHVGRLKLGLKPTQIYVRLSIIPLSQRANHVSLGIIRHYLVAFVCLHFCLTGYQSAKFIPSCVCVILPDKRNFSHLLHCFGFWFFFLNCYSFVSNLEISHSPQLDTFFNG